MHAFLLLLVFAAGTPAGDLKLTTVIRRTETVTTAYGQKHVSSPMNEKTQTEYAKGPLRRRDLNEYWGELWGDPNRVPHVATIVNCTEPNYGFPEGYTVDLDACEYRPGIYPNYPQIGGPISLLPGDSKEAAAKREAERTAWAERIKRAAQAAGWKEGVATVDTGETKTKFGYTAYHVITTMRGPADPRYTQEIIVDGWYIDLHPRFDCRPPDTDETRDQDPTAEQGHRRHGLAVEEKAIYRDWPAPDGSQHETIVETEVTELSEEPLDPTLFQVPPGFKLVKHLFTH